MISSRPPSPNSTSLNPPCNPSLSDTSPRSRIRPFTKIEPCADPPPQRTRSRRRKHKKKKNWRRQTRKHDPEVGNAFKFESGSKVRRASVSLPPLQFQLPLRSCIRFCTEAARKIQERWTGERNDEEREQSSSSLSLLFSPSPSLYPQLPPSRPQLNRIHPSLSLSLPLLCNGLPNQWKGTEKNKETSKRIISLFAHRSENILRSSLHVPQFSINALLYTNSHKNNNK